MRGPLNHRNCGLYAPDVFRAWNPKRRRASLSYLRMHHRVATMQVWKKTCSGSTTRHASTVAGAAGNFRSITSVQNPRVGQRPSRTCGFFASTATKVSQTGISTEPVMRVAGSQVRVSTEGTWPGEGRPESRRSDLRLGRSGSPAGQPRRLEMVEQHFEAQAASVSIWARSRMDKCANMHTAAAQLRYWSLNGASCTD